MILLGNFWASVWIFLNGINYQCSGKFCASYAPGEDRFGAYIARLNFK